MSPVFNFLKILLCQDLNLAGETEVLPVTVMCICRWTSVLRDRSTGTGEHGDACSPGTKVGRRGCA